jgi:uncharacterized protein YodC (DUF2158 family)
MQEEALKIGDIVTVREGGIRMKVAGIDKSTGSIRCTWTRGPSKRTQSFEAASLMRAVAPLVTVLPPSARRR